jgi:hypothetical protein
MSVTGLFTVVGWFLSLASAISCEDRGIGTGFSPGFLFPFQRRSASIAHSFNLSVTDRL